MDEISMVTYGLVLLLAAAGELSTTTAGDDVNKSWLTPDQALKIATKLAERKPFLRSEEANERQTLNQFFKKEDYALLKGNPVFGYWSSGTFLWVGRKVAWGGITSTGPGCEAISPKAWNAAFTYVVHKHGYTVENEAPIQIQGACVYAVVTPTKSEPIRGVVLETRIVSPSGVFRYRFSRGNPTIEGAVGASLELPILLAEKVNKGDWPKEDQ